MYLLRTYLTTVMFTLLFLGIAFTFVFAMDQGFAEDCSYSKKRTYRFITSYVFPQSNCKEDGHSEKISMSDKNLIQKGLQSRTQYFEDQLRNLKKISSEGSEEEDNIEILELEEINCMLCGDGSKKSKNWKFYRPHEYEKIQKRMLNIENEGLESHVYGKVKNLVQKYNILARSHVYRLNESPENEDKRMVVKQSQKLNFLNIKVEPQKKSSSSKKMILGKKQQKNVIHYDFDLLQKEKKKKSFSFVKEF